MITRPARAAALSFVATLVTRSAAWAAPNLVFPPYHSTRHVGDRSAGSICAALALVPIVLLGAVMALRLLVDPTGPRAGDDAIAHRRAQTVMSALLWIVGAVMLGRVDAADGSRTLLVVFVVTAAVSIAYGFFGSLGARRVHAMLRDARAGGGLFEGEALRDGDAVRLQLGADRSLPLVLDGATLRDFDTRESVSGPCVVLGTRDARAPGGYRDEALPTLRATLVARGSRTHALEQAWHEVWGAYGRALALVWSVEFVALMYSVR